MNVESSTVNVENTVPVPEINVENTVPVPDVTINNQISDSDACAVAKSTEEIKLDITEAYTGTGVVEEKYHVFSFPNKKEWENITVTDAVLGGTFNVGNYWVKINDVKVIQNQYLSRHSKVSIDPSIINSGINTIVIYLGSDSGAYVSLDNLVIDYELIPANC